MAYQLSTNQDNRPLLRAGEALYADNATLEQDAGRATALAQYTILAQKAASRKWVPLTSVDPTLTKGKLVCGAFGSTLAAMEALTDGEFSITIDGVAMNITGLDFTGIEAPDATNAKAVCGALGTNLAGFQAVTDGAFNITVDGVVLAITGLDWSAIAALDEVPDTINAQLAGRATAIYDSKTGALTFVSPRKGSVSTITVLSAPAAGTDVSGAGFLNGASATLTQGAGDDSTDRGIQDVINDAAAGRFFVTWDGSRFAFFSPTVGIQSSVSVLSVVSGGSGTDISGSGYLNGRTGTGTATAGTGGDGSDIPSGILVSEAVTAAALVAGDVTGVQIMIGGRGAVLTEDMLTLENSLTVNSVVVARSETVERVLQNKGLFLSDSIALGAYQA